MNYYLPLTDEHMESPPPDSWAIPLTEEREPHPNSSLIDGFQFAWDSVSLNALKYCPRFYQWSILEGYHLKLTPPPLIFGIAFHKVLETWHKLLFLGIDKETALLRCTRLAGFLGETITPGDPYRTKETLVRSAVWYLLQFYDDRAETTALGSGEPAVELSFQLPFPFQVNGIDIIFCGHIDRVAIFNDELFPTDIKTTKHQLDHKFSKQFKPNGQMSGYYTAASIMGGTTHSIPMQPSGIIIDGVQLGVTFSRFQRFIIPFSEHDAEEFITSTEHWVKIASQLHSSDYYPPNEESCDKWGGCVFRDICARPKHERQRMLDSNFTRYTWDPRKSR